MNPNRSRDANSLRGPSLLPQQKDKLIQAIKRIKHEVDECREAERETCADAVEVEHRFEVLEREIGAEFRNLHRFLDEEELKDVERLRRERQKQLRQLKEREKKLVDQGRNLEKVIGVLNAKLAEEDSPQLLREIQDLVKRSHVVFTPPADVDTEVRSGQFVGPIQYRVWKHMKSCLYPNLTPVTFDPETAHPSLSLSPTLTSVWFDEEKDKPDGEPGPRRFHYYYCVLGLQGFTSGRHYWEVEVERKTAWRLGVARADVCRGETAATGTSGGLWTLALKGGAYMVCTDPKPTQVPVSVRLVRVGVFLDCEREEVSFYNAVTMAPIYTFTMGTVLVPLFPFYNPCDTDDGKNAAPIRLFSPSL